MGRLKDLLADNYSENVSVGETLIMQAGNKPDAKGLFMRVGENGQIVGYKAVDQDISWVVTDETDIQLSSSETQLLSMTIDDDVSAANGSYAFVCKINNGSSAQDDNINIIIRDGGNNAIASKPIQIDKGDLGYPVTFFGSFSNNWASGTTFNIFATSNKNSKVMGTLTPTALKVIEARAAPVTAMATAQKELIVDDSTTEPTRDQIVAALGSYINDEDIVSKNFTALCRTESSTNFWQIFFEESSDTFFYHEIKTAK